jgi:hypothetical protein
VPTEKLSTSAAIARDRESIRARPVSWALFAGAIGVAALSVTVWLKVRPSGSRVLDAGPGSALSPLAASGGDGAIATAVSAAAPQPAARVRVEAPAIAAPTPPVASVAPPIASVPHAHVLAPFAPRHALAQDAGAPAVSCNPPWFLDSAGHKQYKPECF